MKPRKWLVAAGALLLSGLLVTGVAVAATPPEVKVAQRLQKGPDLDQLVKEGRITQGQADVMKQIHELHRKAFEQLRADSKAVIDQAVKEGKITQQQADQMMARRKMMMGPGRGKHSLGKGGPKSEAKPSSKEG